MSISREIHLDYEQWENITDTNTRFYEYNHSTKGRYNREIIINEILPIINRIIDLHLTPRQSQVISLYRRQFTQVYIAKILGISQPTVSQHLNGKRRNGKKIGGAFRRIRRKIHENSLNGIWTYEDRQVLIVLDILLDKNITRKRAKCIFNSIGKIL